jgi:predicted dehydrogenase
MILTNADGDKKQIYFDNPEVTPNNAILDELNTFAEAIKDDKTPIVSLHQGTEALRLAMQVIENFNN